MTLLALRYDVETTVTAAEPPDSVGVLVIGSALRQVCGDQAALGLRFVADAVTAPMYRLLVVDEAFAALVRDENTGAAIRGELVEVDSDRWATQLAARRRT